MSLALNGMLHAVDEYSAFLDTHALEDMLEDTQGQYGGIGIQIGMKDKVLTVIAPIEGTPAYRAGLQSGDRIVKIGAKNTDGLTMKAVVDLLKGEKGTRVTLRIEPVDGAEARDVEIVRDTIEVPSVKDARILRDGIGYLRITQFMAPTAGLLREHIDALRKQGMTALVLDLRGNPGGLLTTAVEVAQMFLRNGQLVVSTRGRPGVGSEQSAFAGGDVHYVDMPLAVLINKGSASASEIVAGALADHKRAVLVGETSFGKGSVQSVVRLRSNPDQAIRLTTARYYTPAGRMIHGTGIDPDIPVEVSVAAWRDVQLARLAKEKLKEFTPEEQKRLARVVDAQLERAADLLQAVAVFHAANRK
jgi:carboxyl-terminal processing protease